MTTAWKKRYGFRLKENDQELIAFLDQVPSAKKSDVIRHMLRFAYTRMKVEQEEQKQFVQLEKEMEGVKAAQNAQFQEVLTMLGEVKELLKNGSVIQSEPSRREETAVEEAAVKESAEAFLHSFGVQNHGK